MGNGGEEVGIDVELLRNPDLLPAFVNNGVLMRVRVGSGGADGRLEQMRIEPDIIDWLGCWSGGMDDDGSRSTRVMEGVGDVDVDQRFVLLVAVRVWEVCEEREVIVVEWGEELFRRWTRENGGWRASDGGR